MMLQQYSSVKDEIKSVLLFITTHVHANVSLSCFTSSYHCKELSEMSTDVSIGENKNKDSPMYCLTTKILLPILGTLLADRENEV